MSSGSSAAGGGWIGRPRLARARGSTRAGRCTYIPTRTALSFSAGGSHRTSARCSCRRWPPPARTLYQQDRAKEPEGDPPTMVQQQADALALLAETALHHGIDPGAPGERYQVVVHVDAPVLADPDQPGQSLLEDGARVPAGTSERLACDASRVVMRHDADGRLLEVGARTCTISAGATPCASPPRPRLPIPGLRR